MEVITDNEYSTVYGQYEDSEKRSTSVPCETNGQDQTAPEHLTIASVSSVLLKLK